MKEKKDQGQWQAWLDDATKQLRSHPDCDRARRELLDHLEDRAADLCRLYPDMSREEVERRALAAMGEAEVVSQQLAQAHSRALGMAYWLFYALVRLTAFLLALILPVYLWMVVLPLAVPNWPF